VILSSSARTVLEKRYLKRVGGRPVEAPEDMLLRVARNIAQVEATYGKTPEQVGEVADAFFSAMDNLDFLPNSPTLMNAGRELQQLSACFVLPIEDTMVSIFDSVKNAALIHQSGGGTGFSFSRLRPKNDVVRSTGGIASGPISFLKVFNSATEAVKQGGTRRGANMGILRVDHPDIMEFITCKEDPREITNFNLSVAITDQFMAALQANADYELVNPRTKEIAGKLSARAVFDKITEMAWKNGEPGIVFIDTINRDNPTPAIGAIESTNPCGEQPLLPNEACCLGSVNLAHMVTANASSVSIDWDRLSRVTRLGTRFLDNIIDANRFPLEQIEKMSKANRKIGLGVMGWADMLSLMGIAYDSEEAISVAGRVMSFIRQEAEKMSEELARERGAFPNFGDSIFAAGTPRRNATLTTIAPTGTLSIIAGCSSGIEPVFALAYVRHVLDNQELVEVHPLFEQMAKAEGLYTRELELRVAEKGTLADVKQVPERFRKLFKTALEIDSTWHVKMQAAFQKHTDNAVSKTINMPHEAAMGDVRDVYLNAYNLGCKGLTVYRDRSRDAQVLTTGQAKVEPQVQAQAVAADVFVEPSSIEPRPRPEVTLGSTERVLTGCGKLYVTVNRDEFGFCEVFASMGKSGGCAASQSEAIARLVSTALRSGVKVEAIVRELRGIRCPSPSWQNGGMVLSCADAIGIVLERQLKSFQSQEQPSVSDMSHGSYGSGMDGMTGSGPWKIDEDGSVPGSEDEFQQVMVVSKLSAGLDALDTMTGACPECGGHMMHQNGCATCMFCGYSKCQ
jgi:ribonucleoside-diphosphate reductase alpha chain